MVEVDHSKIWVRNSRVCPVSAIRMLEEISLEMFPLISQYIGRCQGYTLNYSLVVNSDRTDLVEIYSRI
jgi:hypothetical protein